ncbi:hypothetical protein WJ542_21900 [Paraburkholderia sp. B3]|uniref:hypothetical protein n=1 Tax=Paraburkholderia sp. B3 TaxID=3134791 RepID=UPI0039821520
MNRFVNPPPGGRFPRRSGWLRRRSVFGGLLIAASLAAFAVRHHGYRAGIDAATPTAADTSGQVTHQAPHADDCAARAARARSVAEDRDAGVSRQQELTRLEEPGSRSTAERDRAIWSATLLVDGIYGTYATVPAQTIYAKYIQYCETHGFDYAIGR